MLNVDGYYNSLLDLFDKGVDEGFIDSSARHILVIANTAEDLLKKMEVQKELDDFFLHGKSITVRKCDNKHFYKTSFLNY